MTLTDLVFLSIGLTWNGFTFALGVALGISLVERKRSNDNSNSDAPQGEEHDGVYRPDIGSEHRPELRLSGSSSEEPEAHPAKRAHCRRGCARD